MHGRFKFERRPHLLCSCLSGVYYNMDSCTGRYCCATCDVTFPFKSKLERHLESNDHKLFVESLVAAGQLDTQSSYDTSNCDYDATHFEEESQERLTLESDEDSDRCSLDEDSETESELDVDTLLAEVASHGNNFHPFPTKLFAFLFLLVHSPKPIGESNLKFLWFALAQCGMTVPSLSQVKKFCLPGFVPPIRCLTSCGLPYYMISMSSVIQRCIGTPRIAKTVQRFPVAPKGVYREMFHARRWHEDSRFFTPMTDLVDGTHVFIRDCVNIVHTVLGRVTGVILKYFVKEGCPEVYAEMDVLLTLEQFQQAVPDTLASILPYGTLILFETAVVPVSSIIGLTIQPLSILRWDLESKTLHRVDPQDCLAYFAEHPLKEKAAGRPVVILPLILYSDDTSGNRSKKWNKFDSWSVMLAGLPRSENAKIPNIHFLCCSNVISAMDMTEPIAQELVNLEVEGIEAYDALHDRPALLVAPLICVLADNPRASEVLNHLGGAARRYCRMCMVDRDDNPTETDQPRTLVHSLRAIADIQSQSTESGKRVLRTRYGIKEVHNPMLAIPADLFRSTPVETLHSILLGPYKYMLRATVPNLSPREKQEVLARIKAFNCSGFRVHLASNVVRYYQSFVGRDFKAWAQMAPFIIGPYLSEAQTTVWLALSKVFRMAYCDYYNPSKAVECKAICQSFVEAVSEHQPALLRKQKVHLMLHLVESMDQFGPTSAFNTERCESFNSFIRTQNIYGNKGSPSRDIANRFAVMEHVRYICEGGYFDGGQRCGEDLQKLYSSPAVNHFYNCTSMREANSWKAIHQPGAPRKGANSVPVLLANAQVTLQDTPGIPLCDLPSQQPPYTLCLDHIRPTDRIHEFHAVVGQNGQLIQAGNYVELSSTFHEMKYGILLLCCRSVQGRVVCLVQGFEALESPLGEPLVNEYDCPLLSLTRTVITVYAFNIIKAISIVHECTESCCFVNSVRHRNVEREQISVSSLVYEHDFSNYLYCLNIYCMTT